MAKDEESPSRDMVRVKLGTDGVEAAVSEKLPAVIAAVLPVSMVGRRKLRRVLLDGLADRVREGTVTEADADLAERLLGRDEADLLRLEAIRARAVQVYEALPPAPPPTLLPPRGAAPANEMPSEPAPRASTAADWVRKFQDDASLVEDETLAEIYAHILAGEARQPGSVSLRTLGVLRYLDHEVATDFDRLMNVVMDGRYVPMQQGGTGILDDVGLRHPLMLRLAEAGLLNHVASEHKSDSKERHYRSLTGPNMALVVNWSDEIARPLRLSVYLLSTAGVQLARLARVQRDDALLDKLLSWLHAQTMGKAELHVAPLPYRGWSGSAEQLEWMQYSPDEPSPDAEQS
jgi:hypothetical protein